MICPKLGSRDHSHAYSMIGAIIKKKEDESVRYVVDPLGVLRSMPLKCNSVLSSKNEVILKEIRIDGYVKGTPLPENFCDVDRLYQLPNDRAVFVLLADGYLHMFQSGGAFLSRGYDFGNVDKIEGWLMNLFKQGEGLE